MGAITLTILDNANLKISIDNKEDFNDICSKEFQDERHYLAEFMESSGHIGNDWECVYNAGLTEAPVVGQGLIYPENEENNDDGYPIDYENLWYFGNYMLKSFIEIMQQDGFVVFTRHNSN